MIVIEPWMSFSSLITSDGARIYYIITDCASLNNVSTRHSQLTVMTTLVTNDDDKSLILT